MNIFIFNAPVYGDVYGVSDGAIFAEGTLPVDTSGTEEGGGAEGEGAEDEGEQDIPIEIREPLTPEESSLGYIFTPLDDQICRDQFIELESFYQSGVEATQERQ